MEIYLKNIAEQYKKECKDDKMNNLVNKNISFEKLFHFYESYLKNDVILFWTKHCIDWENGGINNIVNDDGTVISNDKYMWSQGRALWTFSALYNHIEKNSLWLKIADNIAQFIIKYGRDSQGAWVYKMNKDGNIVEPAKSVYVDAFVMMGLTEYATTTGNNAVLDIAEEIFYRTSPLLDDHSTLPTEPHRIPKGMRAHGPSMIFALAYHDLGILTGKKEILLRAFELAEIIMTKHLNTKTLDFREFISLNGKFVDSDAGKTFIPGHILESMWFMEKIYSYHKKNERVDLAIKIIKHYIEKGWDNEYGGIFLACHTEGGIPVWHKPDAKVWWTASEALYALLKAYVITQEEWCIKWFKKVYDYAFEKYPNKKDGEWLQNLDRYGKPISVVIKNLQVKDPFHLPRCLILSIEILKTLNKEILKD